MNQILKRIGIKDQSFDLLSVDELVRQNVIDRPMDGNHGEIHPKGEDFVSEGVPFVMATDINDGRVDYDKCARISAKQADSLRKGFAQNGDVLVTHKATIGRTALVRYDQHPYVMLTPQVTYYRVKKPDHLNNRFLKHYFDSELFQKTLQLWADSGSTRAYLGITAQHKLPIIVPPIWKQKKIAAILSAYDELIETNKRRIALLEKMAEEIYREWFVRLRFPGYETVKMVKGVPEGWERTKVSALASYVKRGVAPHYDDSASGIVINQKCIRDGAIDLSVARRQSREVGKERHVQFGDVLVNSTGEGTLGRVAQVLFNESNCIVDSHVTIVRPKSDTPIYYFGITMRKWESHFSTMGRGSTNQTELSPSIIGGIEVTVPSKVLRERYEEIAAPLFQQTTLLRSKLRLLAAARDGLLPRLISGKLAVDSLDIQFPPSMKEEALYATGEGV